MSKERPLRHVFAVQSVAIVASHRRFITFRVRYFVFLVACVAEV